MKAHPAHDGPPPPVPGPGAGGPRAVGPGTEPRGGVLILNWRDTTHPEGGGSEVYVERIAAGLAARGRPVTLLCAAHPGAPAAERVGGIRVVRRGGRLSVYPHAWWAHLTGRLGGHEVVVDVQNGLPFLCADAFASTTRILSSLFKCCAPYLCHQPCYFGGEFAINWLTRR